VIGRFLWLVAWSGSLNDNIERSICLPVFIDKRFHRPDVFGTPQADEGAAAHVFQLLLVVQLPIVAFFAIKWLPRDPRHALYVLALQAAAGLAALAPVFLLHW
jgi:hypothetical protein